jgi:hypothetical protein
MVVVDNARSRIGKTLDIVVTSVLQTTAGRMIFGRHAEVPAPPSDVTARNDSRSDRTDRDETGRRPRSAAQA